MITLYLGKLEYADPLFEILSSNVCPDGKHPISHVKPYYNDFRPDRHFNDYSELLKILEEM
jgi:hypothetical protein